MAAITAVTRSGRQYRQLFTSAPGGADLRIRSTNHGMDICA
jgi:hypothetical protein